MYQHSVDTQLEDAPFLSSLYPTPNQDYGVGLTLFKLKINFSIMLGCGNFAVSYSLPEFSSKQNIHGKATHN